MNITITKTTHPGTLPPSDQLGFGTVFTRSYVPDGLQRRQGLA